MEEMDNITEKLMAIVQKVWGEVVPSTPARKSHLYGINGRTLILDLQVKKDEGKTHAEYEIPRFYTYVLL